MVIPGVVPCMCCCSSPTNTDTPAHTWDYTGNETKWAQQFSHHKNLIFWWWPYRQKHEIFLKCLRMAFVSKSRATGFCNAILRPFFTCITNYMDLSTTRESTNVRPHDSFPAFHGTRRFNTEFTRALHLFLSWTRPTQSTSSYPTSPRSILILSTHLRLGLSSGLFPSGFPTNLHLHSCCKFSNITPWVETKSKPR
jgi:hypothetical protein